MRKNYNFNWNLYSNHKSINVNFSKNFRRMEGEKLSNENFELLLLRIVGWGAYIPMFPVNSYSVHLFTIYQFTSKYRINLVLMCMQKFRPNFFSIHSTHVWLMIMIIQNKRMEFSSRRVSHPNYSQIAFQRTSRRINIYTVFCP